MPMTDLLTESYNDPEFAGQILREIQKRSRKPIRLMEVCGTHTMAIFKNGIPHLLPDHIHLISGPGCPVCVTAQEEIEAFLLLSRMEGVMIATFGDLIRVPGLKSSLQDERAQGADVRIVYSSFDALQMAKDHPKKQVVFLGVGFETTAPTVAASILEAQKGGIENYTVLCANKRVVPALMALMESKDADIDGFILPGHVSTVIGQTAYAPFFDAYRTPSVISGFEAIDLLSVILLLINQIESKTPALVNNYPRAVSFQGNVKAQKVLESVFNTVDAKWRGIGRIPESGFKIKKEYQRFDAQKRFDIRVPESEAPKGCACGDILKGRMTPLQCPLYKTKCTPITPVGPCMVSSEGTCAAYYRYSSV